MATSPQSPPRQTGESYHDLLREGMDAARQGRHASAVDEFNRYLKSCMSCQDQAGAGRAYRNLGVCYLELHQPKRALEFLEKGLSLARELGDKKAECKCVQSMGVAYRALGQEGNAARLIEQGQLMARQLGLRKAEGVATENLAVLKSDVGQFKAAVELHERAISIAQATGDDLGLAIAQDNLDHTADQWQKYKRAKGAAAQGL